MKEKFWTKTWRLIKCFFYHIYMALKRREGFISTGLTVSATGVFFGMDGDGPSKDGDLSFYIKLDPSHYWLMYWVPEGGYPVSASRSGIGIYTGVVHGGPPDTLVCELTPCDATPDNLAALNSIKARHAKGEQVRIRVTGERAFDGIWDHGISWKSVWYAIRGAKPAYDLGWTEIHPVTKIEML